MKYIRLNLIGRSLLRASQMSRRLASRFAFLGLALSALTLSGAQAQLATTIDWTASTPTVMPNCAVGTQTYLVDTNGNVWANGDYSYNNSASYGYVTATSLGALFEYGKAQTGFWNKRSGLTLSSDQTLQSAGDISDVAISNDGTTAVSLSFVSSSGRNEGNLLTFTVTTTAPATSFNVDIDTDTSGLAVFGGYVQGFDCDEDGVAPAPYGTDADDSDPCVQGAAIMITNMGAFTPVVTHTGIAQTPYASAAVAIATLDCDGDGQLAGPDTNDYDACITPSAAQLALNDCDGDSTTVGGGDTNDDDACVNPAYDTTVNLPGGTADDCDGDGVTASTGMDADDAESCIDAAGPLATCFVDADADLVGACTGWDNQAVNAAAAGLTCATDLNDNEVCIDDVGPLATCYVDADMDGTDACVGWTNDANAPAGSCADSNDADTCVDPTVAPGTNDCDMDLNDVASGDLDDTDPCITPAYDTAINIPGGTYDDCDGDGFLFSVDDPDDADECNPKACSDPTPETSAVEQASAASEANGFMHRHMQNEMGTSGQQGLSVVLSANEISGSNRSGVNWYTAGVTVTETGGGTNGEGTFVYATAGFDRSITETSISGYTVGAEYGDWAYEDQPDATKLGLSIGAYAGRKIGGGVSLTGTLSYTHFFNDYTNLTGDTGSMQSDRIMASVGINGSTQLASGATIKPYADVTFAVEELGGFTYSNGDDVEASTADFGEASVGLEVTSAFNEKTGQFFARIEANQSLTSEDTLLPDGTSFTAYDGATGSVGLGWISNGGSDSVGRIEVSASDLGNADREEVTISGHWERTR